MTRRYSIAVLIGWPLIFTTAVAWAEDEKQWGTPEAPPSAKAICGDYYCGDGFDLNFSLAVKDDGKYSVVWSGCTGKLGEVSGNWTLTGRRIALSLPEDKGMRAVLEVEGFLKLEVLKFKGEWILVPVDGAVRRLYSRRGITVSSCFQKKAKFE